MTNPQLTSVERDPEALVLDQRGCFTAIVTAAKEDLAELEGFDHVLSFPRRENGEGAIGPFYSSECICYALNCVYARVYALDFEASDASKLGVDQLSH